MGEIYNEIYLQPKEKIYINENEQLKIGDMCEFLGDESIIDKIKDIKVVQGPYDKSVFIITLLTVIGKIKKNFPEVSINILSERDILIEIQKPKGNQSKIVNVFKIALVCLLLFIGGGVAIMNFHADVNMEEAQRNFYEIITGERIENPLWISIPYSLGIGIGMVTFFNHISPKKRKTDQPSPLDLELFSYQNSLDDFTRHKAKEKNND